jgi:hypothetical protein
VVIDLFAVLSKKSRTSAGKNSQRQGCKFQIRISFLFTIPGIKNNDNGSKPKRTNYNHSNKPKALLCMITDVHTEHNHPRTRNLYMNSVQKSGKINKGLPDNCIYHLLTFMRLGQTNLDTDFLRQSREPYRFSGIVF